MPSYRCISADSHLQFAPEAWAPRVPEKYRDRLPRRITLPNGGDGIVDEEGHVSYGGTAHFAGHGPDGFDPRILHFDTEAGYGSPQQRVQEQDADGVDAELLFSLWGRSIPDENLALAMARAYNEYVAEEFCSFARDRFLGVGVLPHRGVDQDIAEMERCAELGMRAIVLATFPNGKPYPMPEDDRFWAAALDLDMPVTVHTSMTRNYHPPRGEYLIKFPIEPEGYDRPPIDIIDRLARYGTRHCGTTELTQMIMSGIFDRFPKLKIYWAENQVGWIPEYLEQFDLIYEANRRWVERIHGLKPLARRPSEYIKEHAYWGFFDDPYGMRAARYDVGVDHILWGNDFPHEVSRWPHSQEALADQLGSVPESEQRKMLCTNAVSLFHLDR